MSHILWFFFIFFMNETATPEIYTYLHTLSLHDALPIFKVHRGGAYRARCAHKNGNNGQPHHDLLICLYWRGRAIGGARRYCDSRSEEHTSELQSLMRISYAGFCLKKKKTILKLITAYHIHITDHNQSHDNSEILI